jgi:flagellar protein FlaH
MGIKAQDDESRSQQSVISTGVGEIDRKLGGGIPVGSLTLIEGESDAGKSVVAQQMMWGSMLGRHRVLLFTSENTVKSMNTQMASLGFGVINYLLLGWFKVFAIDSAMMKKVDCFATILSGIKAFPDFQLVVVDSLTPVLSHTNPDEVIDYFEKCKKFCDQGRTIINIAHTYAFDKGVLIRVRSCCDAHFKLRIEEMGDKLVKVLEVAKIRGADKSTGNILSFDVEPGMGLSIMPMGKAKA